MAVNVQVEILETDVGDGWVRNRYRRTVTGALNVKGEPMEPMEDEGWAAGPVEPVSREILMDRWNGIMLGAGDATKTQAKLDAVLIRIAEQLTRRDLESSVILDGQLVSVDLVLDDIQDTIRDMMIAAAAKVAMR